MSMAVVYGILNLLIDGIFQDEFPSMMMNFMMRFGLSHEQANTLYGQIFMEIRICSSWLALSSCF